MCKKNGCEEYSICEVGEFLESEYVCPYSVTDEDIVRANDPAARASTPLTQAQAALAGVLAECNVNEDGAVRIISAFDRRMGAK